MKELKLAGVSTRNCEVLLRESGAAHRFKGVVAMECCYLPQPSFCNESSCQKMPFYNLKI